MTKKKITDTKEEAEKRQRGERPVLLEHATASFHTSRRWAPFTDRRAGNLLFTPQSWLCFV